MATAGAYKNNPFTFNYSFVTASDPTTLFTGTLLASEVQVITRDGATTNAAANIASAPTHESNGVFEVNLSASEMNHDEIVLVLVPSAADVVVESISITTEPTPADILEVQGTAVTGVDDFKLAATDIVTAGPITTLSGAVVNVDTVDTVTTNSDMISVSAIVDGVWDEAQSGHTTAGTFGYYLDDQVSTSGGSGSSDWTTTEKNQIRYRLGVDGSTATPTATPDLSTFDASTDTVTTDTASRDASKADVSSLATQASVNTIDTNVDAILVDTGTTLPATLSTIDGKVDTVDTNVDAVLVDTGTTLPATLSTIDGKVDVVDSVADAIKVDTTAILADTSTDGVAISTTQAQAIADEVLKRSVGNVEGASLDEHSLATIVLAILESQRSGSTWTIYRTDGATAQATKTIFTDSGAEPVVRVQ